MGEWDFVIGAVWGVFMTLNVQMMCATVRRQKGKEGN